jgi:hypothetical protein
MGRHQALMSVRDAALEAKNIPAMAECQEQDCLPRHRKIGYQAPACIFVSTNRVTKKIEYPEIPAVSHQLDMSTRGAIQAHRVQHCTPIVEEVFQLRNGQPLAFIVMYEYEVLRDHFLPSLRDERKRAEKVVHAQKMKDTAAYVSVRVQEGRKRRHLAGKRPREQNELFRFRLKAV